MPENTDQTSSWEQVIACSHPTQPTRYYRGYTLRYPAKSEPSASALIQDSLAAWSTDTGVVLTVQYPLLPITEQLTIELSTSSLNFDCLMKFDAAIRSQVQHLPEGQLEPATMRLLSALNDAPKQHGVEPATTTLKVIEGLQTSAFEL